tara:strand:+ start:768 stop:1346 length:579 start_codon:yes stop_codon:yes gene_type:complete
MTVIRLVLFQQPVAYQKLNAALADLDRRDHGDAPGAALTEASCTECGCWFMGHVTDCYYYINKGFSPTFRYGIGLSLFERNTVQGPLLTDHGLFWGASHYHCIRAASGLGLPLHCGDDFATNHQTAKIGTGGFLDELLNQKVCLQSAKRADDTFCSVCCFTKDHTFALRALEKFDDERRATSNIDQRRGVMR